MAHWRWLSSTAWSNERSSSRSKARLTVPLWSKARTNRPERGRQAFLLHPYAHRRPERNPSPGSVSTAKLVPFFAATDTGRRYRAGGTQLGTATSGNREGWHHWSGVQGGELASHRNLLSQRRTDSDSLWSADRNP